MGPGLDEPLLAVKRGFSGMANATQLWLPVVSDDRGQLIAIADSGGQLQGALIGPQYDAGLWNSSGLTSHAQSFNPRRWSTPGGIDTISTFRSRQYDPATGKWLQEDPMGVAGGVNLYGYNGNDPNSFSDPFGLCPPQDSNFGPGCPGFFTAFGAAVGAVVGGSAGGPAGGALGAGAGVVACAPGGPAAVVCGVGGGVAGAAGGAAAGAAVGAVIGGLAGAVADVSMMKKSDIKQVDQAIRKAIVRKPSGAERNQFRKQIHEEKARGSEFPSFHDLVRFAKDLFGGGS